MQFQSDYKDQSTDISALFEATFAASEGAGEGARIGQLARQLMESTPAEDLFVFSALDKHQLVGCIMFSRLSFPQDDRDVFVLSPVAITPAHQGRGVGQELLRHGLDTLRAHGVDIAITYGSPTYYSKVGFRQIKSTAAQPPFELQQPEGWLAQSLTEPQLEPLKGPSYCVDALNDPAYW